MYSCKVMQISLHWPLDKIKYQGFSYANSVYMSGAEKSPVLRKWINPTLEVKKYVLHATALQAPVAEYPHY